MSKTNKKAYIVSLYFQIVFYSSWKKQKKQKKIKIKNDAGENRCIKDFLRGKCLEVCKTSQHNIRLCKVSKRRRELTFTFKGKKKKERGGGRGKKGTSARGRKVSVWLLVTRLWRGNAIWRKGAMFIFQKENQCKFLFH